MLSISCGWELGQEAGQGRCVRHSQVGDRGRLVLDSQQCPVRVETTPGKRDCSMAHTLGLAWSNNIWKIKYSNLVQ